VSLFKSTELKKAAPEAAPSDARKKTQLLGQLRKKHLLGRSLADLREEIPKLEHDTVTHYATGGRWSMHEVILHILELIGPAKMYLTTWTVTEDPMRALFQGINSGMVTELYCVLDYRIEKRKAEAFQLAKVNASKIKLTKCHAKVTVLQNEEWSVSIVSSANLSANPRIEAGVICTDKASAEFHKGWIMDLINENEVFKCN
jgi:hypothetical protein